MREHYRCYRHARNVPENRRTKNKAIRAPSLPLCDRAARLCPRTPHGKTPHAGSEGKRRRPAGGASLAPATIGQAFSLHAHGRRFCHGPNTRPNRFPTLDPNCQSGHNSWRNRADSGDRWLNGSWRPVSGLIREIVHGIIGLSFGRSWPRPAYRRVDWIPALPFFNADGTARSPPTAKPPRCRA